MRLASTDERVFEYVRRSVGMDRAQLAHDLELPPPTVASAVRRLLASGRLVSLDEEQGTSPRGRGRHLLRAAGPALSVGLIRWRRARLQVSMHDYSGATLHRSQLPAPDPAAGPEGLVPAVEGLIDRAAEQGGLVLDTIVIDTAAPVLHGAGAPAEHASGHGLPPGFPVTEPVDIDSHLHRRFGLTFITENDANLAAIGELVSSGPAEPRSFIYLMLDDGGIGSALVIHDQLVRGARGYGGEIAHLQLNRDGVLCHCGGRGCLWTLVRDLTASPATHDPGEHIDLSRLPELARLKEPRAIRLLLDIGRTIGRPLAQLCTVLDPDVVVVDASLGPGVDHVITGLTETLGIDSPPAIAHNLVVRPGLSNTAARLVGALEITRERWRPARRG